MITSLCMENFKSWESTGPLEIRPLTGFFGPNSSGKTSILQMLLMLKQTVESRDRTRVLHTGDANSLVDLGTFFDLIHGHDATRQVQLRVQWSLPEPLPVLDPEKKKKLLFTVSDLAWDASISERDGRPVVDRFLYTFDDQRFGMTRRPGANPSRDEYDLETGGFAARRVRGRPWPLPSPVKCYGFPDEAVGYYQNTGFLPDLPLALEGLLSRVAYLGPLREYPRRSYLWAGERPVDVGQRGDRAIAALLAARAQGLKTGRGQGRGRRYKRVEERVSEWLREMGLIHDFALKPIAKHRKDYELRVRKAKAGAEVFITDVGFGVSQILPVLVLCYYVPQGSTIVLEQPEIHLHPNVQAALADVLIDVVAERNVQIIVESHSEHLLRRLQRRIAEDKLPADDAALYFCRMADGRSEAERLQVNIYGDILNWPDGFFGDEMRELAAKTDAALRRRKAEGAR